MLMKSNYPLHLVNELAEQLWFSSTTLGELRRRSSFGLPTLFICS
jgi:hypothetical protein